MIPDPSIPLLQAKMEASIDLTHLLSLLPPMHKFVLSRSYGIPEKLSLEVIGEKFNKSREYMRLIRNISLESLQEHVRICEEDETYADGDPKANVALLIKTYNRRISQKQTAYKSKRRHEKIQIALE